MRDYGIAPTIWGGDADCSHSWKNSAAEHDNLRYRGNNSNISNEKNKDIHIGKNAAGNSCTRCGAWLGTLGLEPRPSRFIKHLVMIFREVRRVLKDTGSVWVNLGDTYYGSGGDNNFMYNSGTMKKDSSIHIDYSFRKKTKPNWLQPKQLMLLPHRVAAAFQDDGWVIRNDIVWYKRNPMPSSVKDRFNVTKEYMFFMVKKSRGYYFDLDSVREPQVDSGIARQQRGVSKDNKYVNGPAGQTKQNLSQPRLNVKHNLKGMNIPGQRPMGISRKRNDGHSGPAGEYLVDPAGKNPGDVFHLSTESFPDAHFATFPTKLIEKPILATCPAEICDACGEARVRVSEKEYYSKIDTSISDRCLNADNKTLKIKWFGDGIKNVKTIGWTTCDCPNPKYSPGICLDIFGGSGTTAVVAKRNNRNYVLIDAKPEYCEMARKRILRDGREIQYKMEDQGQGNLFK